MTLAEQLARWADKLRDLAAFGLRFSTSPYDQTNYRQVQDIALAMLAAAVGEPPAQLEPLRAPVLSRPTPFVGGDAAVVDEAGRLLLIRRADNGLWAMPGGALEVGETPAEGVIREAWEEAGVRCQAERLVGVFDSRRCGSVTRHHLYHVVLLCRPLSLELHPAPEHAHEQRGVGWFAEADLPADLDPGHRSRLPVVFQVWRGGPAFFDA
ncbi:MAG: NUDIX hydrolase N-terminal domain-containing protein [Anaerolineales bacterium]|nr:NUDIX hydrolase N-terminal domain-containing protein [Anaerolineales bacterium]